MPPTLLAATACGVIFVLRGPDRIFGAALALLFGLALLWMLLSIFLPARGQRTCPECGRETLRRLDSDTTRGIVCSACGHADSEQSSFLLAEEETMIEPIVLRERRAVERARAVKP